MKRAIIVHCWGGHPEYCWYQSTKRELEAAGFEVQVPEMPETEEPKLALWLPELSKAIGEPDRDLFLIGHSAGFITILRYLEVLADGQRIGGTVSVAGFMDDLALPELRNFYQTPLVIANIRGAAGPITAIASDNDTYVPLNRGERLRDELGAELIVKHGQGHFSGEPGSPGAVTELPEVAAAIIGIAG